MTGSFCGVGGWISSWLPGGGACDHGGGGGGGVWLPPGGVGGVKLPPGGFVSIEALLF